MVSITKIPFGLKDNRLVGLDEVESGLACGCLCPACESPLVARKGSRNTHHFSHYQRTSCPSSFETSVHRMAKQIIAEEKYLWIPRLELKKFKMDQYGQGVEERLLITEAKIQKFSNIQLEKVLDGVRPDLIAEFRNRAILIEIFVTNRVDQKKTNLIRRLRKSAIEIDLSDVSYSVSKDELRDLVIHGLRNKRWISLESYRARKKELNLNFKRKWDLNLRRQELVRQHRNTQIEEPIYPPARSLIRKKLENVPKGF